MECRSRRAERDIHEKGGNADSDCAPSPQNGGCQMTKPPLHPVSLRMTFEEKANLEKAAAGMSLAAYIRWRLFAPDMPPPRTRGNFPVKDHKALAQLLALLGQSRLANNVNQLARAANTGSLPVTPDIEEALLTAVREVSNMRALLIQALDVDVSP